MDLYIFSLFLGFIGLVVMTLSGLGSHNSGGHGHGGDTHGFEMHGGHAHGGHAHGGHLHAGHTHVGDTHGAIAHGGHTHGGHGHNGNGHGTTQGHTAQGHNTHTHEHGESRGNQPLSSAPTGSTLITSLMAWLSPRVLFSVILGFGATGTLIHKFTQEPLTMGLAFCGGWGFERLVVAPVWNLLMGFASRPARTLESAVAEEAHAVSNFDSAGQGLISIDLDGQIVQVLGTLRAEDRAVGVRVRNGDRLFVESVDTQRNSCVVSAMGQSGSIMKAEPDSMSV